VIRKPFDAAELFSRVRQLHPFPGELPGPDGDVAA